MTKDKQIIKDAIAYLDRQGERTFFEGGMPAVNELNSVIRGLRTLLGEEKPCVCIHPHICDFNDRCCKNG